MTEPGLPVLETPRLVLRPWSEDDVAAAFDIYSRWAVMRYLGRSPVAETDLAQSRERVVRWAGLPGPLHGVWAIVPKGGAVPVGSALMKLLPFSGTGEPSPDTEIGWHLHPDAWGNGYASEAGARLVRHAWDHGLDEVYAVTYPENGPSQAVCRRLGMTHLGQTDRYYDVTSELFRLGRTDAS
ncbi:MAG: GNAT family N-acetyltransferase [Propionicimonas sp.]|nr:GNAT family N-acetyltransferase [Propionicimonas sp.]